MKTTRRSVLSTTLLSFALIGGCAGSSGDAATDGDAIDEGAIDADLTSASALSRGLKFQGRVYVDVSASASQILSAVQYQTQTAFGPLRNAQIGVNSRELKGVDPATFVKTNVTVVSADGVQSKMVRVSYTYTDDAVVPKSFARRSSISLALLGKNYSSQSSRILTECTANDSEARDFQSSIWYVFDPSRSACKKAIATEQKAIDAAKLKLPPSTSTTTYVPQAELDRLYLSTTVSLIGNKTNKGASYPEYDRLYTGGVQKGELVISLVNGLLDHGGSSTVDDTGYGEWLEELKEIFQARPGFRIVATDPTGDVLSYKIGTKTITLTFNDIIAMKLDGTYPAGVAAADQRALLEQVGERLARRWLTFELPVKVSIGGAAPKDFAIDIVTYFGADSSATPHKRAIKTSDVFVYNGHSYIGYGPLDPSNFSASDFPPSYQILFIDGCVSYNYYEKDYIPLKTGGTRNLELITNGLEAPEWHSGYALGRWVSTLIDGSQASYLTLLTAAADTDSLRVADGELDNLYVPTSKPITVTTK